MGAALRWYVAELDSEFAAYFINYHSRQPYFSTQSATSVGDLSTSKYFIEYPEDIRLYGLSFSTMLNTGTTLAGEISYRPNMPVQISPVDLIATSSGVSALSPVLSQRHGHRRLFRQHSHKIPAADLRYRLCTEPTA